MSPFKLGDIVVIVRGEGARIEPATELAIGKVGELRGIYGVSKQGIWWRVEMQEFPDVVSHEKNLRCIDPDGRKIVLWNWRDLTEHREVEV